MKDDLVFKKPIYVTRPLLPDFKKYNEKIKEIWENKWLTNNGPLSDEFKIELKKNLGVANIELFCNGHTALEIGIQSLDLEGEVITTPFTFASTIHTIVRNGLKPIFCDIEENRYTINTNLIEELITDKTSAILPVHVFGSPCDVYKIGKIAKKYDLKVIYDAAHAFGVKIDGNPIGNFGNFSMFSFHATKVFNTIEGGALSYNDSNLSYKLASLKNFGITPEEERVEYIGQNGKMNEFEAAMGLCNLKLIVTVIEKRKKLYKIYEKRFKEINELSLVKTKKGVESNYSYFTIVLNSIKERDYIFNKLMDYNIFTKKYFYPPCTEFPCYNFKSEVPIAKKISYCILSLPIYPELSENDVNQICDIIIKESENYNKLSRF